jgi:hypothetical protein
MDILEDLLHRIEKAEARLEEHQSLMSDIKAAIDELPDRWRKLGRAIEAKVGPLTDPGEDKPKKQPLPALKGAECPRHPGAVVTANGCTMKGCTYSPPAELQAPQEG